jgi:SAM-dependent methyltransferase
MADPADRPTTRTRLDSADLRAAWEENAEDFIAFARGSDEHYVTYHRDLFLELLPPPGVHTLDLGCGEGRLTRDLKRLGHNVVGVDASPTMLAAGRDADPEVETHLADAAALPFADASFDLVIAFMSLPRTSRTSRARSKRVRAFSSQAAASVSPSCIRSTQQATSTPRTRTARSRSAARTSSLRTTRITSRAAGAS